MMNLVLLIYKIQSDFAYNLTLFFAYNEKEMRTMGIIEQKAYRLYS